MKTPIVSSVQSLFSQNLLFAKPGQLNSLWFHWGASLSISGFKPPTLRWVANEKPFAIKQNIFANFRKNIFKNISLWRRRCVNQFHLWSQFSPPHIFIISVFHASNAFMFVLWYGYLFVSFFYFLVVSTYFLYFCTYKCLQVTPLVRVLLCLFVFLYISMSLCVFFC